MMSHDFPRKKVTFFFCLESFSCWCWCFLYFVIGLKALDKYVLFSFSHLRCYTCFVTRSVILRNTEPHKQKKNNETKQSTSSAIWHVLNKQ